MRQAGRSTRERGSEGGYNRRMGKPVGAAVLAVVVVTLAAAQPRSASLPVSVASLAISVDNLVDSLASTAPSRPLVSETFDGNDGAFVTSGAFWGRADRGLSENREWFAESGSLFRRSGTGSTAAAVFRMWTRRTDLAFSQVALDIRFNRWSGGSKQWHGVNLWLNHRLRTPADGSAVDDAPRQEGYAVDFLNRDGMVYIQKKVGDRYYMLKQDAWRPVTGQWYRWGGRVIDNGDATSTIQVLVDGRVVQEVVDDGSVGGPRLLGGRVGLRSDYADLNVDNVTIGRP